MFGFSMNYLNLALGVVERSCGKAATAAVPQRSAPGVCWNASGAQVVTASQDHTARATWNVLRDRV